MTGCYTPWQCFHAHLHTPHLNVLELETEPAAHMGVRFHDTEATSVSEVLIQWHGFPAFEATWKLFDNIATHFSPFHLKDKVRLFGKGNVMNSPDNSPEQADSPSTETNPLIVLTYKRRNKKN